MVMRMPITTREVDIKEFARTVERLCDFFLDKISNESGRDDSDDQKVIRDLKDVAADIQCDKVLLTTETLFGLADYMKGANIS